MSTKKPAADSEPGGERPQVLQGHRRHGKRFVPLLLEYTSLTEVGWHYDLMPELVWIGLVHAKHGVKRGVELCVELARAAVACTAKSNRAFAFISDYAQLQQGEQECVIGHLLETGSLADLSEALNVLLVYYPQGPLTFLSNSQRCGVSSEASLTTLKRVLWESSDRRGRQATLMQATAVYVYFLNDRLKVPPGSGLANFTAIESYPDTEESLKIATYVRALLNGLTASSNLSEEWRRYFWNTGRALEPCDRSDTDRE